jgi:tungstate transport system permease protein
MEFIWSGVQEAFWMLVYDRNDAYEIALRSLYVSGTATVVSLVLGVAVGATLAFRRFPGRLLAMALVNTGMGFPPVVVGLVIALFLWRSGPLGDLNWIYTTNAIIIAQVIIATPVITGFTAASLASLNPKLRLQIYALGASRVQMLWLVLREIRLPMLAAIMAGFGAAISEVGASVMVGGNIAGETRVLTGAVLLDVSRGQFGSAIAFGTILLAMIIAVNLVFTWVQFRARADRSADVRAAADEAAPLARSPMVR